MRILVIVHLFGRFEELYLEKRSFASAVIKWFQFVDVIAGENFPELYGALGSRGAGHRVWGGRERDRARESSDVGGGILAPEESPSPVLFSVTAHPTHFSPSKHFSPKTSFFNF